MDHPLQFPKHSLYFGGSSSSSTYGATDVRRAQRVQRGRTSMFQSVDDFFLIRERQSSISTEIRAGLANFLTMSYVILVNPQILAQAGIPPVDVVIGTCISSCIATIISGVFGNLPFGLAPGMGLSAYITYGMVHQAGQTWHTALTACLLASLVTLLFTLLRFSERVIDIIPECIKLGTVIGMGLLLAMIGFQSIGLVVGDERSLVALGGLDNWLLWLGLGGLLGILLLTHFQWKGAMVLGILGITLIVWSVTGDWPRKVFQLPIPEEATGVIDFQGLGLHSVPGFLAFVFVGLFDVAAVMYGVARMMFSSDKVERGIPGGYWTFLGASVGSITAALLGCSPIIVHIESAVGVKIGGRTGLTALTTGVLFGFALLFAPLFSAVPVVATAPVLIFVGCLMLGECVHHIRFHNLHESFPAFFTMILMPFTFDIASGLFFGLVSYVLLWLLTGQWRTGPEIEIDADDDTGEQPSIPQKITTPGGSEGFQELMAEMGSDPLQHPWCSSSEARNRSLSDRSRHPCLD